jgi:PAS domain S-box-containing protein
MGKDRAFTPSGNWHLSLIGLLRWILGFALVEVLAQAVAMVRGGPDPLTAGAFGVAGVAGALAARALWLAGHSRDAANQELESVREYFGGIVDSAMDPIITADSEQHIVLFNRAAELAFGYGRDEVAGKPLESLIPERFRRIHRDHVDLFGKAGRTVRRMGEQSVLNALRADGREFPIEASISQHAAAGRRLYTVILRDVSERVRSETELRRSKDELGALANAANQAREQEKTRIARELHDELAQALTALKMDVAWARKRLPAELAELDRKLVRVEETLNETVAATRRIAADLRPMMLDDLGIAAAAEWLVENFTARSGVHCNLSLDISEEDIPRDHATALFRILQESLTNIARHARATAVDVAIFRGEHALGLEVRDNGQGFSGAIGGAPQTFGILGIKERALALGGQLTIDSSAGRGTRIEVCLPLEPAGAAK